MFLSVHCDGTLLGQKGKRTTLTQSQLQTQRSETVVNGRVSHDNEPVFFAAFRQRYFQSDAFCFKFEQSSRHLQLSGGATLCVNL